MINTVITHNKKFIALALGLVFSQSFAQYEIRKYTINSGGSTSAGGTYQLSGSIGQVDASSESSGDSYGLKSGFWHGIDNTPQEELIFKNGFE